jgi:hypothetical protein
MGTTIPLAVTAAEMIDTVIQVATAKVFVEVKEEVEEVTLVVGTGEEREADSKARQVKKMLMLMSR